MDVVKKCGRALLAAAAALALCVPVLAAGYTDGGGDVWKGLEDEAVLMTAADWDSDAYYQARTLTPLGDPSNLRWDMESSELPSESWMWPDSCSGQARWDTLGAFQEKVAVKCYRVGEPEKPVCETTHHYGANHQMTAFSDINFLYDADGLPSGDYYFTVQNLGDGVEYGDSAVVSSLDTPDGAGIYHYVNPGEATTLPTPPEVHWEWPASFWEDVQQEDPRILTYEISYGYSETPAQSPEDIADIGGSNSARSGKEDFWLQERLIGEHGAGWYYFRVRPISSDITRWRHGARTEWSAGYNLKEAAQTLTGKLNAIDKTAPAEDIRREVQALGKNALNNALTADILEAGTGASEAMTDLEKALGGPAQPVVAPELRETFDESQVSIVGAALNNVTGDIALNIGRPREDHVRDENFNNTLAVDFSMELENVADTHDLAVPVKVTLPIPAGINPEFLAVLHYPYGGNYCKEVIHTVFEKDGQWYASFVLNSFSDFTLTEKGTQGDGPAIVVQRDGSYSAVRAPEDARLLLARYNGNRLLSAERLNSLSGNLEGSGKLFLLDPQCRPLCTAGTL